MLKAVSVPRVNTPEELAATPGSSYLQHNNNVWVRLVGAGANNGAAVSWPGFSKSDDVAP